MSTKKKIWSIILMISIWAVYACALGLGIFGSGNYVFLHLTLKYRTASQCIFFGGIILIAVSISQLVKKDDVKKDETEAEKENTVSEKNIQESKNQKNIKTKTVNKTVKNNTAGKKQSEYAVIRGFPETIIYDHVRRKADIFTFLTKDGVFGTKTITCTGDAAGFTDEDYLELTGKWEDQAHKNFRVTRSVIVDDDEPGAAAVLIQLFGKKEAANCARIFANSYLNALNMFKTNWAEFSKRTGYDISVLEDAADKYNNRPMLHIIGVTSLKKRMTESVSKAADNVADNVADNKNAEQPKANTVYNGNYTGRNRTVNTKLTLKPKQNEIRQSKTEQGEAKNYDFSMLAALFGNALAKSIKIEFDGDATKAMNAFENDWVEFNKRTGIGWLDLAEICDSYNYAMEKAFNEHQIDEKHHVDKDRLGRDLNRYLNKKHKEEHPEQANSRQQQPLENKHKKYKRPFDSTPFMSFINALPDEYAIIKDAEFQFDPNRDKKAKIDYIIISRFGIFIITMSRVEGDFVGNEDEKTWDRIVGGRKMKYKNPLSSVHFCQYALSSFLEQNGLPVYRYSIRGVFYMPNAGYITCDSYEISNNGRDIGRQIMEDEENNAESIYTDEEVDSMYKLLRKQAPWQWK